MKSGTIVRTVSNAFQFRLHWESVPNQTANSSTITAKLYYESTASHGVLGYNDSRAATILINGNASNFTYTRNIGANGSKLIGTKTYTIQHNSDGTMSTPVGFSVNFGTTWAGTYYGTINASETAVLDTIQRNSTINGSIPSWTFLVDEPVISVNRSNSTYKHKIKIDLGYTDLPYVNVFWSDFFATNYTITHEDMISTETFECLARNKAYYSQTVRLTLFTYDSSGNQLGYQELTGGLLSSPGVKTEVLNASGYKHMDRLRLKTTIPGSSYTGPMYVYNVFASPFVPEVGSAMTVTEIRLGVEYEFPTNDLYRFNIGSTYSLTTYLSGVLTFGYAESPIRGGITTYTVLTVASGRGPTWNTSSPTVPYSDVNSLSSSISGNNQILIMGKSTMRVNLASAPRAVGRDGASISQYRLTIGSVIRTYSSAGAIPAYYDHPVPTNANSSFSWAAVDSNGQEVSLTVPVRTVSYTYPRITIGKGTRQSDITKVKLEVAGFADPIGNNLLRVKWGLIPGAIINPMLATTIGPSGAFSASTNPSAGFPHAPQGEEERQIYYVTVMDSFDEKATYAFTVDGLRPILFVDANNSAVQVNASLSTIPHSAKLYVAGGISGEKFVSFSDTKIFEEPSYVQFSTERPRYFFDKSVIFESGLTVSGSQMTSLGKLSVSDSATFSTTLGVAGSLSANTIATNEVTSHGKISTVYNTDNGQLEIGSNATNYSSGLRLKRGTANTATIEQHYSGYLNFEYDSNNYLRFGGSNSNSNIMSINNQFMQRTYGKHTILAMANNEIWLQSSTTTFRVHGTNPGVYVRNFNDSAYNNIYAADFVKSSRREVKKNIETAPLGSFKDDVMTTPLYKYHYLDDLDTERLRLGFMMDEVPVDTIDIRGEGLDLAAQVATLWGAVQEVILENEDMKARLLELET